MKKPKEHKVLSPTGILGYGFPIDSFQRGMDRHPDFISVDAGSTDPGPYYLGSGKLLVGPANIKKDLSIILPAAVKNKIPLIIGTAGGAGTDEHVEKTLDIITSIAEKNKLQFRLGVIKADIEKADVVHAFRSDSLKPLSSAPPASEERILNSTNIVAQMGHEPIINALNGGCDVVVCGRCYDPAAFAAGPVSQGFDYGMSYHMGKILECAAIAAVPGSGRDCVLGTITNEYFTLESLNPKRQFTVESTAAHTLYEKSNPYELPGPGGVLDLRDTHFEDAGEGKVKVSNSKYKAGDEYMIKIEGACPAGFRTVSIAGIRDPIMIGNIESVIDDVKEEVNNNFSEYSERYTLLFRLYGKNAVMGDREPVKEVNTHELGIVIEAVADTEDLSESVCAFTRSTLLHFGYPDRISTAGNLAFIHSPSDIPCGQIYEFSLYHLMPVENPNDLFPLTILEYGK